MLKRFCGLDVSTLWMTFASTCSTGVSNAEGIVLVCVMSFSEATIVGREGRAEFAVAREELTRSSALDRLFCVSSLILIGLDLSVVDKFPAPEEKFLLSEVSTKCVGVVLFLLGIYIPPRGL